MKVGMIWAQDAQNGIGFNGDLLFSIPEDMRLFTRTTKDNIVVMGRKTWDSIPERFRPLPNRLNIVLSRSVSELDGALVYSSFEDVLKDFAEDPRMLWVMGGSAIYDALKDYADELMVTQVDEVAARVDSYAVDTAWVEDNFVVSSRSEKMLSTSGHWFTIIRYVKK